MAKTVSKWAQGLRILPSPVPDGLDMTKRWDQFELLPGNNVTCY